MTNIVPEGIVTEPLHPPGPGVMAGGFATVPPLPSLDQIRVFRTLPVTSTMPDVCVTFVWATA